MTGQDEQAPPVLFVGVDWAERHHDVCLMAEDGQVVACERVADGVAGVAGLHELVAGQVREPAEVAVGIQTDRGLLVGALLAVGYQVYGVNPLRPAATGSGTPPRGPGQTGAMRGCWLTWSAPTATTTVR